MQIDFIAIDGGPCGGKTTALVRLSEALVGAGILPLVVPEAATLLIGGGICPWIFSRDDFQALISRKQFENEALWGEAATQLAAQTGKRVVVLCDRGILSNVAYEDDPYPFERFALSLTRAGISSLETVLARYAGVLHFTTAADGAEEFYTLENNIARTETVEQARALDARTKAAWLAHPHLVELANRTLDGGCIDFETKMQHAVVALLHLLGLPVPIEIEDKYLLKSFDPKNLPVPYEAIEIEQTYLVSRAPHVVERVRRRAWRDGVSYIHTVKEPAEVGRVERETFLTRHEYVSALQRADPLRETLYKTRYAFLWNAQYFEVDVFKNRSSIYMEREKTNVSQTTLLPPFVAIDRDVTDKKGFSNFELARIGRK